MAVPLWASFMKSATKGANGLAADACRHRDRERVPHVGQACDRGRARGHDRREGAPDAALDGLHGALRERHAADDYLRHSRLTRHLRFHCRGVQRKREACPHVDDTSLPTATAAPREPPSSTPTAPKAEEPQKKKRGFWSKVFGIGRDDAGSRDQRPEQVIGCERWPHMAFRDIIGHRKLVALLSCPLRAQSLPPSLIFRGRRASASRWPRSRPRRR